MRNSLRQLLTTALLISSACTTTEARRFRAVRHTAVLPPPLVLPAVVYDTSIGLGVDSAGFAALPLRAGAHQYFVNSVIGTNSETCTQAENPLTPVADIDTAFVFCVTNGEGDHIYAAEGTSYSQFIHGYIAGKDGFSAQYPTVIESYDPADPLNSAKYGRGDQRSARPVITLDFQGAAASPNFGGILGGSSTSSYFVIRGLDFSPPNTTQQSLFMAGSGLVQYILFENDIFRYMSLSLDFGDGNPLPYPNTHVVIRNNSIYGGFSAPDDPAHSDANGRSGGFYTAGIDNLTLEDNVMWHTGWQVGGPSRSFDILGTHIPADGTQSHSAYIQTSTTNVIFRRNLTIDPSSEVVAMRSSSGSETENVGIHATNGYEVGPMDSHWSDYTTGADVSASYNFQIAGIANGVSGGAPGEGFISGKGNPGSHIDHNITVQEENLPPCCGSDPGLFSNDALGSDHTSYMEHENNLSYLWNISGEGVFVQPDPLGAFARPYSTYNNNYWDDPVSGTNGASSSLTFPHPYTLATLLIASGYADLNALVVDAREHPEKHAARLLRANGFAGYGRAPSAVDTTAPTLITPSATSPSAGLATLTVRTDDASGGQIFCELLTTGTAPHPSRVKVGVDSSDAPAPAVCTPLTVTVAGIKTFNLTGVPAGTYFAHFVHEDYEGNKSAVVTSTSFVVS